MAVELYRLIEKVNHMDIELLAGEGGLHNLVSWVHMIETIEASEFLDGGEIAFTTGLGISNKVSLLSLIENVYQKKAAGMIVNTGPFLEAIPQDALDFCNAHSFPIFRVPWKIHLAEIMRVFCFSITKDDQRNLETAAAFKNAIFFPKQEELYVVPLSQRDFHLNWKYSACVLKLEHPADDDMPARIDTLTMSLDNYMRHRYSNFAIFSHDAEIIAVVANYDESELHEFIHTLHQHANLFLLGEERITLGVGKLTKSIRCLYKSYAQASSIQRLQENSKISRSLIFYSDMGIYKLLLGVEDKEILQDYYNQTIRPLAEYDSKNNSDLTVVLRNYLKHDGSVKETADELFVHRNTVNYKLNKVEEMLDVDLSSLDTRLRISVGFMLQDML